MTTPELKCPRCKRDIEKNQNFCSFCGMDLKMDYSQYNIHSIHHMHHHYC